MGKIVGITFLNPEAEKPAEIESVPVEGEAPETPVEEEKKPAHSGKKKQETKDGE